MKKDYFLKLSEEVGELAKAMRKDAVYKDIDSIKGTIDEEIWDVIYYALAIANCYDINVESVIKIKEEINNKKYNAGIAFEENRSLMKILIDADGCLYSCIYKDEIKKIHIKL